MDGLDLREEFLDTYPNIYRSSTWMALDCSMLEMMVALARRADFHAFNGTIEGGPGGWFRKFLENLKISQYVDARINNRDLEVVDAILKVVNERTYKPNGRGGLFPLRRPREDQRNVEIWYQLNAYLLENKYVRP